MKKYSFFFIGIFLFATMAFAQDYRSATPERQRELIGNIETASERMKTLRCDFVQKKSISILADELISEGKLSFKKADKLSWEYTKPYEYRFTMNGDKIMINSGTNRDIIDVNSSKMFAEISKIIIMGINGSGIFDDSKFSSKFYVGQRDYQVVLLTKQRDLRQIFSSITLTFDKSDYSVNTVEIKETSGDTTFITMKNKQIDIELDDEIFAIR